MICVDTTFLVDLWREKNLESSPARNLLASHPGDDFAVPAHAAGEFSRVVPWFRGKDWPTRSSF